jgi:hypothetical protein
VKSGAFQEKREEYLKHRIIKHAMNSEKRTLDTCRRE